MRQVRACAGCAACLPGRGSLWRRFAVGVSAHVPDHGARGRVELSR